MKLIHAPGNNFFREKRPSFLLAVDRRMDWRGKTPFINHSSSAKNAVQLADPSSSSKLVPVFYKQLSARELVSCPTISTSSPTSLAWKFSTPPLFLLKWSPAQKTIKCFFEPRKNIRKKISIHSYIKAVRSVSLFWERILQSQFEKVQRGVVKILSRVHFIPCRFLHPSFLSRVNVTSWRIFGRLNRFAMERRVTDILLLTPGHKK